MDFRNVNYSFYSDMKGMYNPSSLFNFIEIVTGIPKLYAIKSNEPVTINGTFGVLVENCSIYTANFNMHAGMFGLLKQMWNGNIDNFTPPARNNCLTEVVDKRKSVYYFYNGKFYTDFDDADKRPDDFCYRDVSHFLDFIRDKYIDLGVPKCYFSKDWISDLEKLTRDTVITDFKSPILQQFKKTDQTPEKDVLYVDPALPKIIEAIGKCETKDELTIAKFFLRFHKKYLYNTKWFDQYFDSKSFVNDLMF